MIFPLPCLRAELTWNDERDCWCYWPWYDWNEARICFTILYDWGDGREEQTGDGSVRHERGCLCNDEVSNREEWGYGTKHDLWLVFCSLFHVRGSPGHQGVHSRVFSSLHYTIFSIPLESMFLRRLFFNAPSPKQYTIQTSTILCRSLLVVGKAMSHVAQ
jgi:hypothetical protein